MYVLLEKADGQPWTSEDHFIIGFDANSLGGSVTADLAPGIQFEHEVEYALR